MLMKNTYLRIGSYMTIRCFNCGELVDILSEPNKITLKLQANDRSLTDEDEDDIIFMSS